MYFKRFLRERNMSTSTIKGYKTAVKKYTEYWKEDLDTLIDEAIEQEMANLSMMQRGITTRLTDFRTHLLNDEDLKISTVKSQVRKVMTIYRHFGVQMPDLTQLKDNDTVEITYMDLPTKTDIASALEIAGIRDASLILFMASSGTGRKECSRITIGDFIKACEGYYTKETIPEILEEIAYGLEPIVPTFDLLRVKTNKRYYTFCTPETTQAIAEWLLFRWERCEQKAKAKALNPNLKTKPGEECFDEMTMESTIWGYSPRSITSHLTNINDALEFGFGKDKYRYLRPHTLRKFNASNIGLSEDNIDRIQGRSKDKVHETYIKTNPEALKQTYMSVMENVTLGKIGKKEIKHEDFHININVMIMGSDTGITI